MQGTSRPTQSSCHGQVHRQIRGQEVAILLDAVDHHDGLAEIVLGVAEWMDRWNRHLAVPDLVFAHHVRFGAPWRVCCNSADRTERLYLWVMIEPIADSIIRSYRLNRAWLRAAISREVYAMAYTYRRSVGGLEPRIEYRQKPGRSDPDEASRDAWEPTIEEGPVEGLLEGELPPRRDGTRPTYTDRPIRKVSFRIVGMTTRQMQGKPSVHRLTPGGRWPLMAPVPDCIIYRSVRADRKDESDIDAANDRKKDWYRRYWLISEMARAYQTLRTDIISMLAPCNKYHTVLGDLHKRMSATMPFGNARVGMPYPFGQVSVAGTCLDAGVNAAVVDPSYDEPAI
jgi:hypothetical protein